MSPDPDDWEWTASTGNTEADRLKSFVRHNATVGYVDKYLVRDEQGVEAVYKPHYDNRGTPDFKRDEFSAEDLSRQTELEISLSIEDFSPSIEISSHTTKDRILLIRDTMFATPAFTIEVAHQGDLPKISAVVGLISELQELLSTGEAEFHCAIESHSCTDFIYLTNEVEHALNPDLSHGVKGPETLNLVLSTFGINKESLSALVKSA